MFGNVREESQGPDPSRPVEIVRGEHLIRLAVLALVEMSVSKARAGTKLDQIEHHS